MKKKEVQQQATPCPKPATDSRHTREILILHFKQGFSVETLSEIFSLPMQEVEQLISTFAGKFSRKEYMMNVIEGLINMKKERSKNQDEDSSPKDKSLLMQIQELKRQLKDSQIETELYKEMVRTAEEVYKIPIIKKFGAK